MSEEDDKKITVNPKSKTQQSLDQQIENLRTKSKGTRNP